jgi:hypothetical protein
MMRPDIAGSGGVPFTGSRSVIDRGPPAHVACGLPHEDPRLTPMTLPEPEVFAS